jgi:hypothetical protein
LQVGPGRHGSCQGYHRGNGCRGEKDKVRPFRRLG